MESVLRKELPSSQSCGEAFKLYSCVCLGNILKRYHRPLAALSAPSWLVAPLRRGFILGPWGVDAVGPWGVGVVGALRNVGCWDPEECVLLGHEECVPLET